MSETKPITILGICGSLRAASYNGMALRAARELLPPGVMLEIFDALRDIPPYDDDARRKGYPPAAQNFREQIKAADALLFVTPEYNYSVPGVLKNAIDWASRPPEPPVDGKPVAIMGASPGKMGTVRAQQHLRQITACINGLVLNKPEVVINNAASKFDAEGRLIDEETRTFIAELMAALAKWTRQLQSIRSCDGVI